MEIVTNNPYRIAGLLIGTSAREQDRQIRRLKQYIGAEQEPEGDYSFPILGQLHRNIDNVDKPSVPLHELKRYEIIKAKMDGENIEKKNERPRIGFNT